MPPGGQPAASAETVSAPRRKNLRGRATSLAPRRRTGGAGVEQPCWYSEDEAETRGVREVRARSAASLEGPAEAGDRAAAGRGAEGGMKNLMLYVTERGGFGLDGIRRNLDLQVDNGLELGWRPGDLLLYTNFPFSRHGVRAIEVLPGKRPRTARMTSFHK